MTLEPPDLRPTSQAQYRASTGGTLPPFELIRDGIGAVAVPVGMGNVPYTFCYLIEDAHGALHVLDPGDNLAEGWALLMSAMAAMGRRVSDVATITVTHFHPDHLAIAERLRAESGARLALHPLEVEEIKAVLSAHGGDARNAQLISWGVPEDGRTLMLQFQGATGFRGVEPDYLIEEGSVIDAPGRTLLIRHTPGHTPGHICLQIEDEQLFLSGDHVIPTVVPGIGLGIGVPGGGAIDGYLASLADIEKLDAYEVLPGHGFRFRGLASRARFIRDHHLTRTREVSVILEQQPDLSVWEVARQLTWTATWEGLSTMFRFSALAQTSMHMDFVVSGRAEPYLGGEPSSLAPVAP